MTKPEPKTAERAGMTRRGFGARAAAVSAAGVFGAPLAGGAAVAKAAPATPAAPVVSFHMDRPYVDPTGRATPYLPANGVRGAATLEGLSEEALRRRAPYL